MVHCSTIYTFQQCKHFPHCKMLKLSAPRDFLSNSSAENAESFSKSQQLYIAESAENAETFSKSQQLYILLKMLKTFFQQIPAFVHCWKCWKCWNVLRIVLNLFRMKNLNWNIKLNWKKIFKFKICHFDLIVFNSGVSQSGHAHKKVAQQWIQMQSFSHPAFHRHSFVFFGSCVVPQPCVFISFVFQLTATPAL